MIPPSKWSLSDLSQRATCRRIGLRRPSHVIQSIVSKRATSLSRTGANSTNNRLGATRARRNASEGQAPSRVSRGRSALRTHEYGLRTDKFRLPSRARTASLVSKAGILPATPQSAGLDEFGEYRPALAGRLLPHSRSRSAGSTPVRRWSSSVPAVWRRVDGTPAWPRL